MYVHFYQNISYRSQVTELFQKNLLEHCVTPEIIVKEHVILLENDVRIFLKSVIP